MRPTVLWDLTDDPDGNVAHIAEHGLTPDEVESVLDDPHCETDRSRKHKSMLTFGWTHAGRHVAVAWVWADREHDLIYVRTAYEIPPPRGRRRRRPR